MKKRIFTLLLMVSFLLTGCNNGFKVDDVDTSEHNNTSETGEEMIDERTTDEHIVYAIKIAQRLKNSFSNPDSLSVEKALCYDETAVNGDKRICYEITYIGGEDLNDQISYIIVNATQDKLYFLEEDDEYYQTQKIFWGVLKVHVAPETKDIEVIELDVDYIMDNM